MTLVSTSGNKIYYNTLDNYDGLPSNMKLYVSGVQVALVTFNGPYLGLPFAFERNVSGTITLYYGVFTVGRVDF
jgi:hypothetical protein